MGQIEKAIQAFKTALKIEPKHPESIYNLAMAALADDDMNTATDLVYQLCGLDDKLGGTLSEYIHTWLAEQPKKENAEDMGGFIEKNIF